MEKEQINQIQSVHGQMCTGLAKGIQAASVVLEKIGGARRTKKSSL